MPLVPENPKNAFNTVGRCCNNKMRQPLLQPGESAAGSPPQHDAPPGRAPASPSDCCGIEILALSDSSKDESVRSIVYRVLGTALILLGCFAATYFVPEYGFPLSSLGICALHVLYVRKMIVKGGYIVLKVDKMRWLVENALGGGAPAPGGCSAALLRHASYLTSRAVTHKSYKWQTALNVVKSIHTTASLMYYFLIGTLYFYSFKNHAADYESQVARLVWIIAPLSAVANLLGAAAIEGVNHLVQVASTWEAVRLACRAAECLNTGGHDRDLITGRSWGPDPYSGGSLMAVGGKYAKRLGALADEYRKQPLCEEKHLTELSRQQTAVADAFRCLEVARDSTVSTVGTMAFNQMLATLVTSRGETDRVSYFLFTILLASTLFSAGTFWGLAYRVMLCYGHYEAALVAATKVNWQLGEGATGGALRVIHYGVDGPLLRGALCLAKALAKTLLNYVDVLHLEPYRLFLGEGGGGGRGGISVGYISYERMAHPYFASRRQNRDELARFSATETIFV